MTKNICRQQTQSKLRMILSGYTHYHTHMHWQARLKHQLTAAFNTALDLSQPQKYDRNSPFKQPPLRVQSHETIKFNLLKI